MRTRGVKRYGIALLLVALVATFAFLAFRHRITDDEQRERLAARIGVPAERIGSGMKIKVEMAGDHDWYITGSNPTNRVPVVFSTCRGHLADYIGDEKDGPYLLPPGYTPPTDGKFTADDARTLALRLATVYWLQDAPSGATLAAGGATLAPGGMTVSGDEYLVQVTLENAGRGAPRKATFEIDPHGRGCLGIMTEGWDRPG